MNAPAFRGLVLALDTTRDWCAACLWENGDAIAHLEEEIGRGHAERLAPLVKDLLAQAGRKPAEIGRIGVTVGPGSFMGVRIGVSFARAFASALGPPGARPGLVGVTTFAAARPAPGPRNENTPCAVIFDARRGQVYAQAFDAAGDEIGPPFVDEVASAARRLGDAFGGTPARLLGDGAELVHAAGLAGEVDVIARPSVVRLAAIAAAAPDPGDARPTPLYLRPPDAKAQGPAPFAARS